MANGFYLIIMSFLYHEIGVENVKLIGLGDMRGKSTTNILCSNDFAGSKSDKKLGVLITKWNDESNVLINMQKVKIINYPLCSFIKIMENTKKIVRSSRCIINKKYLKIEPHLFQLYKH